MLRCNLLVWLLLALVLPLRTFAGGEVIQGSFQIVSPSRIGGEIYYRSADEWLPVRLLPNRFSPSHDFVLDESTGHELVFYYKDTASEPEEGESPAYHPIGRTRISRSGDYIVILSPVYEDPERPHRVSALRCHTLPNLLQQARPGTWFFVNATNTNIASELGQGGERLQVAARSHELKTPSFADDRNYELIRFAARRNGEARIFYSTGWMVHEESKFLVLFLENPHTEDISVLRIAQ